MASIRTILDELVELEYGKQVAIGVTDKNEFETVRTALSRTWAERKKIIYALGDENDPSLLYGLCGKYESEEHTGYYWLGLPRKRTAKSYSFSVVVSESATDRDTEEQKHSVTNDDNTTSNNTRT